MGVFLIGVELTDDVPIQCAHDADAPQRTSEQGQKIAS
jgi:hypothetical protein